jgi:nitroimidazol reductase NimA-like FMN-containing flavoprotein (pyridoxamine 5'-phosphate oxidase superfamily)
MMAEALPLTATECEELLRQSQVGRVAVCSPDGPHVVPVNYVLLDQALVFRTSPYSVVGTHGRDAVVALEIDQVDEAHEAGWSVLARGRAVAVTDPDDVAAIRQAWSAPPWAAGMRTLYLRMARPELTGRRLAPTDLATRP